MHRPSISVVIPAYNAESTLPETVETVRTQTLPNIEIIVVDDGSIDGTRSLAQQLATRDQRIRVISTRNGGVAAARNVGIEAAQAAYIAPVDADDLWHPDKLSRQLAILEARPEVTLVYSSRRNIDEASIVTKTIAQATLAGWACHRLTAFNAVGNGSAIMFRRADALQVGGYDRRLKERGAQGCEDFLFQIRLAMLGEIAVDEGYLVGYRKRADAMSNDDGAMLRSRLLALDIVEQELPELATTARATYKKHQFFLGLKVLAEGDWRQAGALLGSWTKGASLASLADGLGYVMHRQQTRKGVIEADKERRLFADYAAGENAAAGLSRHLQRILNEVEPRDIAYAHLQDALQRATA
ncbi:glycosyltransferase family 2 protein [Devosia sp. ZW T5_3]|uniref:glycosyltransferase family 2 protein n=1 Tax=Devosia sp. ZW T5_3 TaxID=3378085 RepID=UPI00385414EE